MKDSAEEKTLTLAEVPAAGEGFVRRLTGDTIYFKNMDGTDAWIKIAALPRLDVVAVQAMPPAEGERHTLRAGIKEAANVKNEQDVVLSFKLADYGLAGKLCKGADDAFIEGLPYLVQERVSTEIVNLSLPSREERARQVFTKGSELAAGNGALGTTGG